MIEEVEADAGIGHDAGYFDYGSSDAPLEDAAPEDVAETDAGEGDAGEGDADVGDAGEGDASDASPDVSSDLSDDADVSHEPDADAGETTDGPVCPEVEGLWDDVALEDYEPILAIDRLPLDEISPAEDTTYWELRRGVGEDYTVVSFAGGLCTEAELGESCNEGFEGMTSDTGFAFGCFPGGCPYYLAVNRGDTNSVVNTAEGLLDFFGDIDAEVEAVLVALANGYSWSTADKSTGGLREVEGGYQLLLRELVAFCAPVITDRVDATIFTDGAVQINRRQVVSVMCSACI
jgi:hypothetical protein